MIKIVDTKDHLIAGYWNILENEQSMTFIPEKKWKKGNYRIIFDSHLEDVAGNNLENLLDHNKTDKEHNKQAYQAIEFKL